MEDRDLAHPVMPSNHRSDPAFPRPRFTRARNESGAAAQAYAAMWAYGDPAFGPVVRSEKYSGLVLPAAAAGVGADVGGAEEWRGRLGRPVPADACVGLGATALKGRVALLAQGACGIATQVRAGVFVRVCACMCACARACVRACAREYVRLRACVRACVCMFGSGGL